SLERDAMRRCDAAAPARAVWCALAARLRADGAALRERFAAAARQTRDEFTAEIRAAAARLYDQLRRSPKTLAGLRAARATADVASIALAIKTGGLHLNDVLIAPAVFATTSLLTEGALGSYMRTVADDLKRRQQTHVRREFF